MLTVRDASTSVAAVSPLLVTGVWLVFGAALIAFLGLVAHLALPVNERRAQEEWRPRFIRNLATYGAENDRFIIVAAKILAPLCAVAGVTFIVIDVVR